jgi:hypothetical protein
MAKRRLKILVSGMIAGDPWQGGATWAVLQYILGFRQLGHEVVFVEPIQPKALKPLGACLRESENATYFGQVVASFDVADRAALLLAGTKETLGITYDALLALARSTDLLINISGMLVDDELTRSIPTRAYLDLDPAFNQLWSAVQGIDMRFSGHTHHITIGQSIGKPDCPIPTCGFNWLHTLQPVVLENWPVAQRIEHDGLTTVGNWRGYGSIEHEGVRYGQKAHSIRKLLNLPKLTKERFMPALSIHPAEKKDLEALSTNGWELLDPLKVAGSPEMYQKFIQSSKAEFGVAKSGYVLSQCGWFSDRSACYLASGRPVIAQETGFSSHLPMGHGLFAFKSMEDVLTAIDEINRSYERHSSRARLIAEEFFDSRKVLVRLLEQLGL